MFPMPSNKINHSTCDFFNLQFYRSNCWRRRSDFKMFRSWHFQALDNMPELRKFITETVQLAMSRMKDPRDKISSIEYVPFHSRSRSKCFIHLSTVFTGKLKIFLINLQEKFVSVPHKSKEWVAEGIPSYPEGCQRLHPWIRVWN